MLRGLDVDVDALRARLQRADLDAADGVEAADPPARPPAASGAAPRCPSCGSAVAETGVSSTVVAAGDARIRLLSCSGCGTVLGATPA